MGPWNRVLGIRYRYDGTFPIMYQVIFHLISQEFQIMSTCAFVKMHKYPRYFDLLGRIRNKGFDIITYDKLGKLFIGIEVKPEFSGIEFKHALGQTLTDLTETRDRVDQAIIVMPHKDLQSEDFLKNKFNYILKSYDFPISMKYLPIPCKTYRHRIKTPLGRTICKPVAIST
jgi:hypothetical protein